MTVLITDLLVDEVGRGTVRCAVQGCTHGAAGTQALDPEGPPQPVCASHFRLAEPYPG